MKYALLLLLLAGCNADPYANQAAIDNINNTISNYRAQTRPTFIPVQPVQPMWTPSLLGVTTRCSTFGGSTVCNTN